MAAFSSETISRLHAVLAGFMPASAAMLFTAGFFGRGGLVGGATLATMGLALGALAGVPAGLFLARRDLSEADYRLPFVVGLLGLPLALLPIQPEVLGSLGDGEAGWASVLASVLLALPLGVAMGASWSMWQPALKMPWRTRLLWAGIGFALGASLAAGSVSIFSAFKGSALVNLFAAPLVWPTLPDSGGRSLLARMLLTLVVLLSTMFLLFL